MILKNIFSYKARKFQLVLQYINQAQHVYLYKSDKIYQKFSRLLNNYYIKFPFKISTCRLPKHKIWFFFPLAVIYARIMYIVVDLVVVAGVN